MWHYVKRLNLCLIGVHECDRQNESKLENTLHDIIQKNIHNLTRQAHASPENTENTTKIFLQKSNPRHIIIRFTKVEMKEKMLKAAREKGQVPHKGKPIRLTVDLLAETLQARR